MQGVLSGLHFSHLLKIKLKILYVTGLHIKSKNFLTAQNY